MNDTSPTVEPLYSSTAHNATIYDWSSRHGVSRLAANEIHDVLKRMRGVYEAERATLLARIAELEARLEELNEWDLDKNGR